MYSLVIYGISFTLANILFGPVLPEMSVIFFDKNILWGSKVVVVVRHERAAVVAHLAEVVPDAVPADQDEIPGTGRAVAYIIIINFTDEF